MKKKILIIAVLSLLASTSVCTGSCNIPTFIKKGAVISFYTGGVMSEKNVTVVEIDQKTCWIRIVNHKYYPWVNLNNIVGVLPEGQ